jgi:hypothetical protein
MMPVVESAHNAVMRSWIRPSRNLWKTNQFQRRNMGGACDALWDSMIGIVVTGTGNAGDVVKSESMEYCSTATEYRENMYYQSE